MRGLGAAAAPPLGSWHFHREAAAGDQLDRARAAADRLLGPYGVVRHCRAFPQVPGLPTTPIFVARGPKRGFGGRNPGFDVIGMGVSDERDDARLKAVVEAVERYCFAWPHGPTVVERHPYAEVEGAAVPLDRFRPYSDSQYGARPELRLAGPLDPIDWTPAYSLTREGFVLVPASVALSTVGFRPPNNFLAAGSSTGVACHVSMEAALLAGLLEVVERDAIMHHWFNRRQPRRVVVDQSGEGAVASLLEQHFAPSDFEFSLLDITADTGIPTICCRASSTDPERPASAFGAATRPDPAAAARKALFECAQVLAGLHGLGCDARSSVPVSEVRQIWDHARYYASAANVGPVTRFASSDDRVELGELAGFGSGDAAPDLQACVDRLAAADLEVLCVDLTPPDVAAAGLHTVKVIVPGMVDLNGDARLPQLGSFRLRRVTEALGWPPFDERDANLAPCPMS